MKLWLAVAFFAGYLCFAVRSLVVWDHGYYVYKKLCVDVNDAQKRVFKLRERVIEINEAMNVWNNGEFIVEKTLREDFLMSKPGEVIFYVKEARARDKTYLSSQA
ncbi:septum formation initiator family protein [Candidatus Babeliales bacterium]|nr:septum formation initiator family protein [Candidatus Babeliales bacterium]